MSNSDKNSPVKVKYNFEVGDDLDFRIKQLILRVRKDRGGKLNQKDFLPEIMEKGVARMETLLKAKDSKS